MPLGSPNIVGPVTPCCDRVRVQGQFSGSRVRVFVEGDPVPIGDATVPWSDYEITIDRSRLVVGKRLVASQESGAETSQLSPKGVKIEPPAFGAVKFEKPPYVCGRSVLLQVDANPKVGAAAGSRVEIWQGGTKLGTGTTVGTLCRVEFDPGMRVVGGAPLDAFQFICTSGTPQKSTSELPLTPPLVPVRKMPPVTIDGPIEECVRLITVRQIVPGAVLRIFRSGSVIFDRPVPLDEESVFVATGFSASEEIVAEQTMVMCEFATSDPNKVAVIPLVGLTRPRIDGPLCDGPGKVTVSRLKPGASVILFADGVEIGRWEASNTTIDLDLAVPNPPATLTAQQRLCGQVSAVSRGYTAATGRSGRWFVVENAGGENLKADAFAVHAGLVYSGKIVLFSGDQHNPAENQARPQDIDHAQLFDCQSLTVQKIDAPTTDVFCSGHAILPDGRLVVAGGTERFPLPPSTPGSPPPPLHHDHFPGLPNTWLFDPAPPPGTKFWAETSLMRGGRWYPTLLTLRDGRVLALSGHPEEASDRHNNNSMELFDATPAWNYLGDSAEIVSAISDYLYPRLHALPGGDVFSSTPMRSGQSGRWSPSNGTTWANVSPAPASYGDFSRTSVLLPLLPEDGYRAIVAVAGDVDSHFIDFGTLASPNPSPAWQSLGPRSAVTGNRVRVNCHAVILPTTEVLIVGGVEDRAHDETHVFDPELLQRVGPGQWKWSADKLAAATVARNYHSTALLMPDGRVWTAGGNINAQSGGPEVRRLEVEIYEPWYCCAERPVVREWPTVAHTGQRIIVRVFSRQPITRLALVRCGSATHAFNPDQRYVGLANVVAEGSELYIGEVPAADIAIPGYYLLFACTDKNVPSIGVFVQIRA